MTSYAGQILYRLNVVPLKNRVPVGVRYGP